MRTIREVVAQMVSACSRSVSSGPRKPAARWPVRILGAVIGSCEIRMRNHLFSALAILAGSLEKVET